MYKNILIILLFFSSFIFADSDPVTMMEKLSNNLTQQLDANKSKVSDPAVVGNIIKQTLIPKVDKEYMSQLVVGPRYWKDASQDEKVEFIKQFETMVTNTYARIFSAYSNQEVKIFPYRGDASKLQKIEIKSFVIASSKSRFKVIYKLIKDDNDSWLIYDFSIDGISMIGSYKSQFAPVLASDGLKGLIDNMREHNKKSSDE
ncbi:MAG: ABC transporter substrate-binding protein [Pseudomonadota bacterium]|nr:ABC transporter substrate-binding protein [Pseudomonadota bacterium]